MYEPSFSVTLLAQDTQFKGSKPWDDLLLKGQFTMMWKRSLVILTMTLITTWAYFVILRPGEPMPDIPQEEPYHADTLRTMIPMLQPLHIPLGEPESNDWLANHDEPGQSFDQYVDSNPVTAHGERHVLYIQPFGNFTDTQRKIVVLTAEYMKLYFNVTVTVLDDIALSDIPETARRKHPSWGMEQVLTTYVLHTMLPPRLPEDGLAIIAFTASDLWPGEGWNFVFGQASIRQRVGVWSIHRNGDPDQSAADYQLCLRRTLKTATHETGHMLSMRHCIKNECNMCGANHRQESDRHPLWLCPKCLAKVCIATKADPIQRYQGLRDFCKDHNLTKEETFFHLSIKTLEER